jgi:hypothetical protein
LGDVVGHVLLVVLSFLALVAFFYIRGCDSTS